MLSFARSFSSGSRGAVFVVTTAAAFLASMVVFLNFSHEVGVEGNILRSSLVGCEFRLDQLSLLMVLLSTFLFLLCALCSVFSDACGIDRQKEHAFFALLTLLEAFVICVFVVDSSVLFYAFFEASLIPMFFIIGFWGHGDRVGAAFRFLIYTATASLLFLVAIVYSKIFSLGVFDSFNAATQVHEAIPFAFRIALWSACFLTFAVKLPMVPCHTWLPKAHVQAPTLGSVLLAGILIKMGGYGFVRFCLCGLPAVSFELSKFVIILSAISLVYSSLIAYSQKNMKALVAYSSIAHMSFVSAGIFSLNESGILGAIFQMISHGLISAALFLCVGMIYRRTGTMEMEKCGGLAAAMPRLSFMMIFFSMASAGLPGTSGFVGEFLSILGVFQAFKFTVVCFAVGVVLSAAYMLRLCKEVVWGSVPEGAFEGKGDINAWEFAVLGLLAVLVVVLGVFPSLVISPLKPWVGNVLLSLSRVQ